MWYEKNMNILKIILEYYIILFGKKYVWDK